MTLLELIKDWPHEKISGVTNDGRLLTKCFPSCRRCQIERFISESGQSINHKLLVDCESMIVNPSKINWGEVHARVDIILREFGLHLCIDPVTRMVFYPIRDMESTEIAYKSRVYAEISWKD